MKNVVYGLILISSVMVVASLVLMSTGHTEASATVMGISHFVVTLFALYLAYEVVPYLEEIKRSVVGRVSYIRRATEIYSTATNISAMIEGWDANDDYMRILVKRHAGVIRFLGPIEENSMTLLGALARLSAQSKRANGHDQIQLRHIDRANAHFKFIIGERSVLIGEEFGVRDAYHGSESGYLLVSESEARKYLLPFQNEFERLWAKGVDARERILTLAKNRFKDIQGNRVTLKELLEHIVLQREYTRFFTANRFVAEHEILSAFQAILASDADLVIQDDVVSFRENV